MTISIASGKGGVGKTTVAVSLALSLEEDIQFLDCDVEEPNAHIFLKPTIKETIKVSTPIPKIDETKCNFCGRCSEICAYNAIAVIRPSDNKKGSILVFPNLCHSCGGCSILCPQEAIREINREIGILKIGNVNSIQFIYGYLNIGEAMSPPVIKAVKKKAEEYKKGKEKIVIIDAPPGTSCPVIEAVKDSDFCILVTEPTPFGLNDLILAVEVVRKLKIPLGVIVNRFDIGDREVENFCNSENIPILMRIPFKREIASGYSKGIPLIEVLPEYKKYFQDIFRRLRNG